MVSGSQLRAGQNYKQLFQNLFYAVNKQDFQPQISNSLNSLKQFKFYFQLNGKHKIENSKYQNLARLFQTLNKFQVQPQDEHEHEHDDEQTNQRYYQQQQQQQQQQQLQKNSQELKFQTQSQINVDDMEQKIQLQLPKIDNKFKCDINSVGPDLGIVTAMSQGKGLVPPPEYLTDQIFEVVEFDEFGGVRETFETPQGLGLHPRDLSLFAHHQHQYQAPQRATVAVRDRTILVRTELCKAVIFEHRALLFPCKKFQDSVNVAEAVHQRILSHFAHIPFKLKVLEALLDQTAKYFENKARKLCFLTDSVLSDLGQSFVHQTATGELQKLLPLQRRINEVINDVEETRQALEDIADDEAELRKLSLGYQLPRDVDPHDPRLLITTVLLDSYEHRIRSVHGTLQEQMDNIESCRMTWHMQLDSIRNRIIQLNLGLSMGSLWAVFMTIPASYYGMNVPNGLEEAAGIFYIIAGTSGAISTGILASLFYFYRYWPIEQHRSQVRDMNGLKYVLLNSIDHLDDIMQAMHGHQNQAVTKRQFREVVQEIVGDVTQPEMDVLYKVFVQDKSGSDTKFLRSDDSWKEFSDYKEAKDDLL